MKYSKARRKSNTIGGSQQFDQASEEERGSTSRQEVPGLLTIHRKGIQVSCGIIESNPNLSKRFFGAGIIKYHHPYSTMIWMLLMMMMMMGLLLRLVVVGSNVG